MGCTNGKGIRKRQKEQTMDSDPLIEQITSFKNEIEILRNCLFQVLNIEPKQISTFEDDINYIQEQTKDKNISNLLELISCYQLNIVKRKNQIQSLIFSSAIQSDSEQVFASETSLSMQKEKKIVLDEMTQKVLKYCYISNESNQENIQDDSVSCITQQQNQQ
ncbi:hypothetical protein ABPG74_010323 [Tetrahymena malaccensis]